MNKRIVAGSQSYAVNGQNRLTTAGAYSPTYDARGNLSGDGVNSYGYDENNNLINFNSSATTLSPDPLGRLMSTTDYSGGTATTASRGFRYGGSSLLAEYGSVGGDSGVLHGRYVPGPGTDEVVALYTAASGAAAQWPLTDERGSVVATTAGASGAGAVVGYDTYDDYGKPAMSNTGRIQYTGQMYLSDVGVYSYKARAYSPSYGRFLQTDPIGYGDGLNWYAYVHDDPINMIDSSGMGGPPPSPSCPTPAPCPVNGNGGCPSGQAPDPTTGQCVSVPDIIVTANKPPAPPPTTCDANNNCVGEQPAPTPSPNNQQQSSSGGGSQNNDAYAKYPKMFHDAACEAADRQAAENHASANNAFYASLGVGGGGNLLSLIGGISAKILVVPAVLIAAVEGAKSWHDDHFASQLDAEAARCHSSD